MDDKVFGTVKGHPLWAVYKCGSEIRGKIDIGGAYREVHFAYRKGGNRIIEGTFDTLKMALGNIEESGESVIYPVFAGDRAYRFSIRYERVEGGHMVNSIIEGDTGGGNHMRLSVDGRLCPFATTGIVMIVVGAVLLSGP
jgi:hypothetical protein